MSLFVTFEGPEGSGKSTQARLLDEFLRDRGYTVTLTREPGGTPLGEQIRELLLDPAHGEMDPRAELFLYLASRAQHVQQHIRPALERGEVVISDRFSDASLVYQGMARDVGVKRVRELNRWATRNTHPDLTFILDVPLRKGLSEAREGSSERWSSNRGDRIEQESEEFHRSVKRGYRTLAEQEPERCVLLKRDRGVDALQDDVRNRVLQRLQEHENQPSRQ